MLSWSAFSRAAWQGWFTFGHLKALSTTQHQQRRDYFWPVAAVQPDSVAVSWHGVISDQYCLQVTVPGSAIACKQLPMYYQKVWLGHLPGPHSLVSATEQSTLCSGSMPGNSVYKSLNLRGCKGKLYLACQRSTSSSTGATRLVKAALSGPICKLLMNVTECEQS